MEWSDKNEKEYSSLQWSLENVVIDKETGKPIGLDMGFLTLWTVYWLGVCDGLLANRDWDDVPQDIDFGLN